MSIASMILGESGTGKSTSLRNMSPSETLLIKTIEKPLPFPSKHWKPVSEGGNVLVLKDSAQIIAAMKKTSRPVIVVDDFQYLMATEFMARAFEKGYDKWNEMASHYYDVFTAASALDAHKRVYLLSHVDTTESGLVRAKTLGRLLNDKLTVEGFFTLVFRALVINGKNVFSTKNSGNDTVKTAMGMFDDEHIDNDLAAIDQKIVDYYELKAAA